MASPYLLFLAAGLGVFTAPQHDKMPIVLAAGGGCGAAADAAIAQTGGELLSAEPSADGTSCIVTVLVQEKNNARPRKITLRIPM
ncbi:MAG: hypothetical protein RIR97_1637 [Pseudomonadota bacterium]|jgi:hypothetical protein